MLKWLVVVLLAGLTTGCGVLPASSERLAARAEVSSPCFRSLAAWRDFTRYIDGLPATEQAAIYNKILAEHSKQTSPSTRLKLAFLHTRVDPTLTSLSQALRYLDSIDPESEWGVPADALRREIVLLSALTHQYLRNEQELREASSNGDELQRLKGQVESLQQQLKERLRQLEMLRSIESEMMRNDRRGGVS